MHQFKTAVGTNPAPELTVIVEREQETINLEKIAAYRGLKTTTLPSDDGIRVKVSKG